MSAIPAFASESGVSMWFEHLETGALELRIGAPAGSHTARQLKQGGFVARVDLMGSGAAVLVKFAYVGVFKGQAVFSAAEWRPEDASAQLPQDLWPRCATRRA